MTSSISSSRSSFKSFPLLFLSLSLSLSLLSLSLSLCLLAGLQRACAMHLDPLMAAATPLATAHADRVHWERSVTDVLKTST